MSPAARRSRWFTLSVTATLVRSISRPPTRYALRISNRNVGDAAVTAGLGSYSRRNVSTTAVSLRASTGKVPTESSLLAVMYETAR